MLIFNDLKKMLKIFSEKFGLYLLFELYLHINSPGKPTKLNKQMANPTIYINVCDVKTDLMSSLQVPAEIYSEILSEQELKQFSTQQIMSQFIEEYKSNSEHIFIMAVALVNRHIKSLDFELSKLVKSEKHNCFTIIIDKGKAFVFGSTPSDTYEYSQTHGQFLSITYKSTVK